MYIVSQSQISNGSIFLPEIISDSSNGSFDIQKNLKFYKSSSMENSVSSQVYGNVLREFCKFCESIDQKKFTKIAFSHDSSKISGGRENGEIIIWDLATNLENRISKPMNESVTGLSWDLSSQILIYSFNI